MDVEQLLREYFASLDAMDVERMLWFFSNDCELRIANGPPVRGIAAVRAQIEPMFAGLRRIQHTLTDIWIHPDATIVRGEVTYTRLDGAEITLPFITYFRLEAGRIGESHVFMDIAPLFGPAPAHASKAA